MFNIYFLSTVPGLITPMLRVDSVSEFTIDWSRSDSAAIVRYIVDVRKYASAGPGKVQMTSVTGYPQQIPGTDLEHTVKSLSKHFQYIIHNFIYHVSHSMYTAPEVPYDVKFVAANIQGCGDLYISQPFFTREGGNIS